MDHLKKLLRIIPNFPKPGVNYIDITPILKDAATFNEIMNIFYQRYKNDKLNYVVGIESRGFILGAALADKLNIGFVPIRKPGKLPYKTISAGLKLEYGQTTYEIHIDAIDKGEHVLIVDDVLATGGTTLGAIELVKRLGGIVVGCAYLIELPEFEGRKKLAEYSPFSLITLEQIKNIMWKSDLIDLS